MKKGQVFGIPTYDAMFKWVLSEDSIRPSFFHAFIPGIIVKSSERLDDHMNPLQELQLLRDAIHDSETTKLVTSLKEEKPKVEVHIADSYHEKASELLKALLLHFEDIKYSFPKPKFDGKMDFVCRLDTGEYALVEMQIWPENQWDDRALAYVAAFYGYQLRKGSSWKDIRKVIGLNILGGGKDDCKHWPDTPNQYMRHYKLQEQLHKEDPPRCMDGLDIIQYSLANVPKNVDTQEQKDWLLFFKNAHNMTEEDVKREIKTTAVLKAFERARLISLPDAIKVNYDAEDVQYENLSEYIEEREAKKKAEGIAEGMTEGIAEGIARGKAEEKLSLVLELYHEGCDIQMISRITKLPTDTIKELLKL